MANKVEQEILRVIRSVPDFRSKKYLVGYSGGVDSTALIYGLAKVRKVLGVNVESVFFMHSNSPLSHGEEENKNLVERVTAELGLVHTTVTIDMSLKGSKSWEQYGREQRLAYARASADVFLTGHHADDQLETTLIQLFRGAGAGCTGMLEVDELITRPLLRLSKSDLVNYLTERSISWLDDPTNSNTDFTRNFWRSEIIPKLKEHYSGLDKTVETIRKKMDLGDCLAASLGKEDLSDLSIPMKTPERCFNAIRTNLRDRNMSAPLSMYERIVDNWGKRDITFVIREVKVTVRKTGIVDLVI